MPRNSSGTYSLPAGNPVVSNTLIQSTWANTTLSDVSTAMTDSLDRNGRGAMLAALKNIDGTAVAPSITFSSEGTLGIYRPSAGVLGIAAGGALVLSIAAAGLTFTNPIILPIGSATAPSLTFVANTNTGVYSPTTNQVAVTTNGAQRLLIDATGNVTVATGNLSLTTGALVFPAAAAAVIEASNAAGTLAFQTGGANTRLSIDAAGTVTVAGNSTLTGAVGVGGAPALGKLQVFGGVIIIDNAQSYAAKSSGGTLTSLAGLDASNNLLHGSGAAVATQQFSTGGTTRLTIDATGNVGFRTTPSAWGTLTAIEGSSGALGFNGTAAAYWMQNLYFNGSSWIYKTTAAGSVVTQSGGGYSFNVAASGTAGAVAPLNTVMTLDNSGRLGIGMTPTTNKLEVAGSVSTLVSGAADTNFAANVNGIIAVGMGGNNSGSTNPLGAPTGTAYLGSTGSGVPLVFTTASTERLRITSGGVIQDGAGNELGYKGLPQTVQSTAYTLLASDRGKHVYMTGVANVTVPASVFSIGDVVTVVNGNGSSITIVQGASASLFQAGTASTGNRTLLVHGVCSILCIASNSFIINGNIT